MADNDFLPEDVENEVNFASDDEEGDNIEAENLARYLASRERSKQFFKGAFEDLAEKMGRPFSDDERGELEDIINEDNPERLNNWLKILLKELFRLFVHAFRRFYETIMNKLRLILEVIKKHPKAAAVGKLKII